MVSNTRQTDFGLIKMSLLERRKTTEHCNSVYWISQESEGDNTDDTNLYTIFTLYAFIALDLTISKYKVLCMMCNSTVSVL